MYKRHVLQQWFYMFELVFGLIIWLAFPFVFCFFHPPSFGGSIDSATEKETWEMGKSSAPQKSHVYSMRTVSKEYIINICCIKNQALIISTLWIHAFCNHLSHLSLDFRRRGALTNQIPPFFSNQQLFLISRERERVWCILLGCPVRFSMDDSFFMLPPQYLKG